MYIILHTYLCVYARFRNSIPNHMKSGAFLHVFNDISACVFLVIGALYSPYEYALMLMWQ